jgi:uncharacterized protein (TIGR03435 family)
MKAVALLALLCVAPAAGAQPAAFEVASVKPDPEAPMFRFSLLPGGQLVVAGVPLATIIQRAYGMSAFEIADLPEWAKNEKFAIRAKAPDGSAATTNDTLMMLRGVLEERFGLRTRVESRDQPVYLLEHAGAGVPLGSKLTPSSVDCSTLVPGSTGPADRACGGAVRTGGPDPSQPWTFTFRGRTMARLAKDLQLQVGRVVVDRTSVPGAFDVELSFTPEARRGSAFAGLSIYTAVREQLGLHLEAARVPVPILVVEALERPTPD